MTGYFGGLMTIGMGDDGRSQLAEDHYFNNTIEGLRQDRDAYKTKG